MSDRQATGDASGAFGASATRPTGEFGTTADRGSAGGGMQRSGASGPAWGDQAPGSASEATGQMVETAKQKADQVVGQVSATADAGIDRAATGLDRAAEMLRERAGAQGGSMESMATVAADKLDAAAHYLQGKDSESVIADLEALVRRRPTESVLVALGIGFLLSKALR
jgi:hypothetical protein